MTMSPPQLSTPLQPIDLFAESIKSPATRKSYLQSLRQFRRETGFDLTESTEGPVLEKRLIEYTIELKRRGLGYSRINTMLNAIQRFTETFDIEVRWKKVRKYLPEHIRNNRDRSYTKAELRILVEHSNPRIKALILLFVATGIRAGAVASLRLKHLTKMQDGCYKVSIYDDDESERYPVFTTPECTRAIDYYLKSREQEGELLRQESPLIRKEFSACDANKFEPIVTSSLARIITRVAIRTGIRQLSGGKRQEIMLLHGMRKFHNSALIRAGVKPVICEMLLGHNVGLQFYYLRLTENEIYAEYKKAETELTISEEPLLRDEVERLKLANSDIGLLKATVMKQSHDMALMQKILERYAEGEIQPLPAMTEDRLNFLAEEYEREMLSGH